MKIPKNAIGPWLVAAAAFMWAIDAPFRKFLTTDLSSGTIVLMEHILIAVLVLPLFIPRLRELKQLNWKEWLAIAFIAIGGSALATIFFTQSFRYINPTVTILLQKLQPLVAIGLAVLILKETLSKRFWGWAILAIAGAYLLTFPTLNPGSLALGGQLTGVVFALLAVIFWGGSTVFGRLVLSKISFEMMTSVRFLGALIFLFILNLSNGNLSQVAAASARDWLFVFIIAVIAGFAALYIYYRGLRSTKASVATLAELTFPLSAVVINWIFLGESLILGQIIGGALLIYAITKLSLLNAKEEKAAAQKLEDLAYGA